MENQTNASATPQNEVVATSQTVNEKLIIKRVSFVPMTLKDGTRVDGVVIHTKPSGQLNKPKAGENESRFRVTLKQFENIAKGAGYDDLQLFSKDCIGGTFELSMKRVKAGETWTSANGATGVYAKDGFGEATRTIVLSGLVIEEDRQAHRNAYYMHKFASKKSASAVSIPVKGESAVGGDDIAI